MKENVRGLKPYSYSKYIFICSDIFIISYVGGVQLCPRWQQLTVVYVLDTAGGCTDNIVIYEESARFFKIHLFTVDFNF